MAPTILVTGGAGFIGSALVRHLIADTDWHVVNVDRLGYASSLSSLAAAAGPPRHIFIQADIRDGEAMAALLARHQPRAVLHLAAETHVDRSIDDPTPFIENNLVGTFRLLEAVRAYWCGLDEAGRAAFRFVNVSTDEVFGSLGEDDPPFTSSTAYRPNSPYSASKAGADHLVRAWGATYGMPVVVTNCSNNYGPYQFPEKLIPLMIIKALHGEALPVYGSGRNVRDWLYVDDHARALVAAAERGRPGATYLIGGNAERRNMDIVHAICDCLDEWRPDPEGSRRRLVRLVADRPGHDFRYAIDPESAIDGLDWKPRVDFADGIRATLRWYLDHESWWREILAGRYDCGRLGIGNARTHPC